MKATDRLDEFLKLSVSLTGFGRLQLVGTGVAQQYLDTLDSIVSAGFMTRLLEASVALPPGDGREAALSERVLGDPALGPVARNIIVLWYCGTWQPLPDDWCQVHGRAPSDLAHVVSPEAYLAGLQWTVGGAHPPGGLPGGFASWAGPPPGADR